MIFVNKILVLRLGHRIERDKRVSTHVGLVARAFNADGIIYSGEFDNNLINSIKKVIEKWGGPFLVSYTSDWKREIKNLRDKGFIIIHLTMYGLNLPDVIESIKSEFFDKKKNLVVVVGSEKVPRDLYEIADYNVAIGNQPHSEIAALAVFLDWLFEGKELLKTFNNAKIRIIPSARGKKVVIENSKSSNT